MGGCCEKRSNAGIAKLETKGTIGGGITSDEIPKILELASKYFSQSNLPYTNSYRPWSWDYCDQYQQRHAQTLYSKSG